MNNSIVSDRRVDLCKITASAAVLVWVIHFTQTHECEALAVFPLAASRWSLFWSKKGREQSSNTDNGTISECAAQTEVRRQPPTDTNEYLDELLSDGRHTLLLRPQVAKNLIGTHLDRAFAAVHSEMALVPEGDVELMQPRFDANNVEVGNHGSAIVRVEPIFLDRFPVTNRCFKRFVDAECYADSSLWDHVVLTGVLDFVDQTGCAGPRYWRHGTYADCLADHPVVGVSQYEAAAYARWVGKRLPTDAEWVKAGVWPVNTAETEPPSQRKYPWGDSMDGARANLWASGPGRTVEVTEYPNGVSVGGVHQLIGNVWEWTNCVFGRWHENSEQIEKADGLVSIRGGAYDTYFDSHAVCQFQSGDNPLARKHNIGFRCAVSISELTPETLNR